MRITATEAVNRYEEHNGLLSYMPTNPSKTLEDGLDSVPLT